MSTSTVKIPFTVTLQYKGMDVYLRLHCMGRVFIGSNTIGTFKNSYLKTQLIDGS